ncbi:MAG TPA: hypothetical protein VLF21_03030 [Candidatus Saccharimonadales bacterium]|nr:hypothetical protein [Candidatus Saccharimonadales bacterium]
MSTTLATPPQAAMPAVLRPLSDMQKLLVQLADREIETYTSKQVQTHKDAWRAHVLRVGFIRAITLSIIAGCWLISMIALYGLDLFGVMNFPISDGLAALGILGSISAALAAGFFMGGRWVIYTYADYATRYTVPDVARRIAVGAMTIPGVKIHVDRLKSDPVMWAHLGTAQVCIAIWKKPGYHQPLIMPEDIQ